MRKKRKENIVPDEEFKLISKKDKTEKNINIDINKLTKILEFNTKTGELNKDVFSLFPNIKIAIEIMTSSILSPNTMTGGDYNLSINTKLLPLDISGSIINIIKDHIDSNYKFKDNLYTIIEETVYTKGSYCELILPPDLIADLYRQVNKKKNKSGYEAGIESYIDSFNNLRINNLIDFRKARNDFEKINKKYEELGKLINISENYSLFIRDKIVENTINNSYNYGLDAGTEDSTILDTMIMLDSNVEIENEFNIATAKKIPSESVIPISDKDDPTKHYGYFVFLNNVGTPINTEDIDVKNNNIINFGLADKGNKNKISSGERLISKAKNELKSITAPAPDLDKKEKIVENILLEKIRSTLKNSELKDLVNYDIELKQEVSEYLFKKIKNNEKVNIVFVPDRYMMYYAINYRENGTGKSVLEDVLLLASIKAMLLLTRISAYIRSNIVITDVKVELDEDDPQPEKTLIKVLNYIKKGRQMQLPIGMLKVNDLVDWLHNVGFKVTASHPNLPRFELDMEENALPINVGDDGLDELLDKYITLAIGPTPEMVDNSYSPDFATTIVANNVLMSRRIASKQKKLNPLFKKHLTKILNNDPMLYNKIISIIKDNIPDIKKKIRKLAINEELKNKIIKLNDDIITKWVFKEIMKNIVVELPKPELQEDDPNSELFDKLSDKLDKVLDVLLSTDMFDSDLLGELSDKVENQKNILKGLIIYKWMSQNRFLPEVVDAFSVDEDGKPILNLSEEYKTLVESLKANVVPLLKEMNKFKEQTDKEIEKVDEDTDEDTENNESSDTTGNSDENTTDEDNENSNNDENSTEDEDNTNDETSSNDEKSDNGDSEDEDLTKGLF